MTLLEVTEAFVEVRDDRRFPPSEYELIKMAQACRLLHRCPATIRAMVARGELPAVKPGRDWQFERHDVERVLEARRVVDDSNG